MLSRVIFAPTKIRRYWSRPADGAHGVRLLFRWFVGLGADEPVWDDSTFSKNRDRLLEGAVAARFLSTPLAHPRVKRLLSTDHFSVDGTTIQAWASMKSVKPIAGSDEPPPAGGAFF
jgi:transposase